MRLVILGGSGSSTPELADAIVAWPGGPARRPPLELVLHGRSADRLEPVATETRRRLAVAPEGHGLAVETETDRHTALEGADVVLNAVRIGGLTARAFDETFPRLFGIPGEETMGPGGFANALRTVPVLRETWSAIADVAPEALVVNLTNPAGVVQAAALRETDLQIVSVCDSPANLCIGVAEMLGRPLGNIHGGYLGMNHLGWWVPGSEAELAATSQLAVGLEPEVVQAQAAVGAAYVRYYVHPDRILATQVDAGETRAEQLLRLDVDLRAGFAGGATELPRRGAAWYPRAIVPLLDAWLHGSAAPLILGLPNGDRVPWLPSRVSIEGPVTFPGPGLMETMAGPALPTLPAAMLAAHAAFEELTVDAILAGSPRHLLVRALLANPMVHTYDQTVGLVDAILAGSPR